MPLSYYKNKNKTLKKKNVTPWSINMHIKINFETQPEISQNKSCHHAAVVRLSSSSWSYVYCRLEQRWFSSKFQNNIGCWIYALQFTIFDIQFSWMANGVRIGIIRCLVFPVRYEKKLKYRISSNPISVLWFRNVNGFCCYKGWYKITFSILLLLPFGHDYCNYCNFFCLTEDRYFPIIAKYFA